MSETTISRDETLAKLAQSRADICRVLDPPSRKPRAATETLSDGVPHDGSFPRSRTMKLLMSGRGLGTVGAVVGGLVLARPAVAFRMLRMLPTGAVARMLILKAVTALRSKHS